MFGLSRLADGALCGRQAAWASSCVRWAGTHRGAGRGTVGGVASCVCCVALRLPRAAGVSGIFFFLRASRRAHRCTHTPPAATAYGHRLALCCAPGRRGSGGASRKHRDAAAVMRRQNVYNARCVKAAAGVPRHRYARDIACGRLGPHFAGGRGHVHA